jgi:hypothetical protein
LPGSAATLNSTKNSIGYKSEQQTPACRYMFGVLLFKTLLFMKNAIIIAAVTISNIAAQIIRTH